MKQFSFIIIFLVLPFTVSAQFIADEEPEYASDTIPKFTDKLFFGGNLGLMFGSYTYINISPIVGYQVKPSLAVGVGVVYEYVKDNRFVNYNFETTIWGGKLFVQTVVLDFLILYAENNFLSLERQYYDAKNNYPETGRFFLNVPWVGGGIFQKAGNGGVYLMILFNLNTSMNSPYSDYEFRIGINF